MIVWTLELSVFKRHNFLFQICKRRIFGEWVWSNYRKSDTVWARPNVDARPHGIRTFCENQFFEIRIPT